MRHAPQNWDKCITDFFKFKVLVQFESVPCILEQKTLIHLFGYA